MRRVDALCNAALGRNTEDWRSLNVCEPCMYKLEKEPQLQYSMLCSIDGNASLKQVASKYRHGEALRDDRGRRAEFWVTEQQVNAFEGNVRNKDMVSKIIYSLF